MAEETGSTREQLLDAGERHFYQGDYEAALAKFDEAIAEDEDDAEAHYLRARALFYLSRDEDAEVAFDRALDIDPEFAPALIHKAELFVRGFGWPDEAVLLLEEADDLDLTKDDRLESSFVRGLAEMARGDYRKALEPLNRAVRGDAEWGEALRERGICRFFLWRFEDARRDLETAAKSDDADPEVHHFLGMVYERLGKAAEAEKAFADAVRLDPKEFHAPTRLARPDFERVAAEAIAALPEEFRLRFDNLSFGVEDLPAKDEDMFPDALGLFVGQALTERNSLQAMSMPGRILLFQRNLERTAPDLATLKEEIGKTVLHEVGHFFGLNEEDMVRLDIH